MSTNFLDKMSLCNQINAIKSQKLRQQITFPNTPSRIDSLESSPYIADNNSNIRFELDMRRKAEVLKYNNTGNTKTNKLTKKEIFALVMKGNAPPVSNSYIKKFTDISNTQSITLTCNNKNLPVTTTPSSASGVPNDYINGINTLYFDQNISLYNYINPILTRSYGIINNPDETNVIRYSNYQDATSKISTIEFTDNAVYPSYVVNILNIPLGIQVYGDISATTVNFILDGIDLNSNKFELNTYYQGDLVIPNSKYTYIFTPNNNECIVDVSSNTVKDGKTFSATAYIGSLTISNIVLFASPGYLYDFTLNSSIITPGNYKMNNSPFLTNITASIVYNVSSSFLTKNSRYNNCVIRFSPTPITIPNDLGIFTITA